MDFWSFDKRKGNSCFRSPSPTVRVKVWKPGHSGLAERGPTTTGTSAGNLYVARSWRSILAAISVGLDCEAQFRPITDKRTSDRRMSNREKAFTLDPLYAGFISKL